METEKYKGTMYERFDSKLTDSMLAADNFVKKLEYLNDHIDHESLSSSMSFLRDIEKEIVNKCVTPHFKLTLKNEDNASDLLLSILFQARMVFKEIRNAWLSSRAGYTPALELGLQQISEQIYEKDNFRLILNNMNYKRNIV
ncbi:MAG: hypothetical protein J5663_03250 [Bacteroidaceae bacterium]|nr:hypothetical protein [Bacteroidaceae bacterium]